MKSSYGDVTRLAPHASTSGATMPDQTRRHHVTIRLVHRECVDGSRTPWKWRGQCTCGWGCLSWQWIAVDRPGGTLPMALDHLGKKRDAMIGDSE